MLDASVQGIYTISYLTYSVMNSVSANEMGEGV